MLKISVQQRDIREVRARLARAADGRIGRSAQKALVRAAKPVARDAGRKAQAVKVGSKLGGAGNPHGTTDLRARVAAAVDSGPAAGGAVIFVNGPIRQLAQYLDTEDAPRWRHPVFGRRAPWETNRGSPWFYVTIRAAEGDFAAAVDGAVADIIREISA